MTGIMIFETTHGRVAVEIEEGLARHELETAKRDGRVSRDAQAVADIASVGSDLVVKAPKSFSDAMITLKAYAANLEDLIAEMPFAPKEVSVEIGLKLVGSLGFVIAKAGGETEMKVSLKWGPKK
jgi:hypothetical protein